MYALIHCYSYLFSILFYLNAKNASILNQSPLKASIFNNVNIPL